MLGSDYELFMSANGAPHAAIGYDLPDKSEKPIALPMSVGFIHRDNLMVEINSLVAETGAELAQHIRSATAAGLAWLRERNPDVSWLDSSSARFETPALRSPEGSELGCDSDFVAARHSSFERDAMSSKVLGQFRCAGAHLHFSQCKYPAWVAAMVCDLGIGIPEGIHLDARRAQFYGSVSLHRPTAYPDGSTGVEYRPLDSYWVRDDDALDRVCSRAEAVHTILASGTDAVHKIVHFHMEQFRPQSLLVDVNEDIAAESEALFNEILGEV